MAVTKVTRVTKVTKVTKVIDDFKHFACSAPSLRALRLIFSPVTLTFQKEKLRGMTYLTLTGLPLW
jgi:hypothetical protein